MVDKKKQTSKKSEVCWLNPQTLSFSMAGTTLRLTVAGECSYLKVTVLRAFPISRPWHFLSVRDIENEEVGIIADMASLDADSRRLVEAELARRYLVAEVQRVLSARERFGVVDWEAETNRGRRRFTTRDLRDNATRPQPGCLLFTDVDGNRYLVTDLGQLDPYSRGLLISHT